MTPNFAKERLAVLLDQACDVAKEIGGPWLEKLVGEWTSVANTYRVCRAVENYKNNCRAIAEEGTSNV